MQDISLKALLEAGCHFGHREERWHAKAAQFIYQGREGIHIIDLAKTRDQLKKASELAEQMGRDRKVILFVATKRQAKGIVAEAAKRAGLPYMTNRWIGGFLTNWSEVKKNIDKINKMKSDRTDGSWNKFPKHEIVKMEKELRKLEAVYGGVINETNVPDAIFIIDVKKEIIAIKEANRKGLPTLAIADTNANPDLVDYPIPANDDAIGSIQCIMDYFVDAYIEGKAAGAKEEAKRKAKEDEQKGKEVSEEGEEKPEVKAKKAEPAVAKEAPAAEANATKDKTAKAASNEATTPKEAPKKKAAKK
jgi:small subunit ribosomal protein S2